MTVKPRRSINCYLRVCVHENKKNYRGGFAQVIYQLTGEFNTIKERSATSKKIFWDNFSKSLVTYSSFYERNLGSNRAQTKRLWSNLEPRFLPSVGLPPRKVRHCLSEFPSVWQIKEKAMSGFNIFY